jgi:hypothetical protein
MRKFVIGLAAMALAFVIVAPNFASAGTVAMTHVMRWRGVTTDDTDGNSRNHDNRQVMDHLVRPRWTYKTEGGKVWSIFELDAITGGGTFGNQTGRHDAQINRWLFDFAIPGTTFRYRVGRTDWRSPDGEVIGGAGLSRTEGMGIYGKLFGPVKLTAWWTKTSEGVASHTDVDLYYLAFAWKAAPAVTITPWLAWEHDNSGGSTLTTTAADSDAFTGLEPTGGCAAGQTAIGNGATDACFGTSASSSSSFTPDADIRFWGGNVKAKFGIASINVTGIYEEGNLDFGRGSSRPDIKIRAWAALIRLWLNFGKLKVGFYGSFFSGDDDITSGTGRAAAQSDNKLTRFVAPRAAGSSSGTSRINGPQLFTNRRFTTQVAGFFRQNRSGAGDGGVNGNGAHIYEILAKYKLTRQLELAGNISLIRSAAKRANLTNGTTFDSSKSIGTEIDLSAKYNIYKSVYARLTWAYMFAGDYGKETGSSARDFDDSWALFWELRHTFKQ